jgi:hypothetical protein
LNRKPHVLLALIAVLLFGTATATGASASSSDGKRALADAQAIFNGQASASTAGAASGREATLVLRDLADHLDELSGADLRAAKRILARPDDPGDRNNFGKEAPGSPICNADFCVHWGTSAKAAPLPGDANANDIPDFAEATLAAGAHAFAVENTNLGWPKAISDKKQGSRDGKGTDGQVDVYLTKLPRGLYGYATTEGGVKQGSRKRSAYLVLDNDYAGFGGSSTPVQLMQVTMAHEYNHILQFGIDTRQDGWMFESSATFVEDYVYPDVNDYINFVPPFAKNSTTPLAEEERTAFKLYGSAVWNHFIAGKYGPSVVRDAWQLSPSVKPQDFAVAAYDKAIKNAGGTGFAPDFVAFAAATAEWGSSTAFHDPALLPGMKRTGSLGYKARKLALDHTGYALMDVKPQSGDITLKVKAKQGVRSGLALIGRTGPEVGGTVALQYDYLPKGGKGKVTLPAGLYSRVTAMVANADGRVKGNSRFYTKDNVKYTASLGG